MNEDDKNIILKLDRFFESKNFTDDEKISLLSKMSTIYISAMVREMSISDYIDSLEADHFDDAEDELDALDDLDVEEDVYEEEEDYMPRQPVAPVAPKKPGRPPNTMPKQPREKTISEMSAQELNDELHKRKDARPQSQSATAAAPNTPRTPLIPPKAPTGGASIVKRPAMKITPESIDKGDY